MSEAFKNFREDLQNNKAPDTQAVYEDRFKSFMMYCKIKSADVLIDTDKKKFEDLVHEFIKSKVRAGKKYSWLTQAVSAIRIFCIANRLDLNYAWINSKIPKPEFNADDSAPEEKPYSLQQISQLVSLALTYKQLRAVVAIFVMYTGGARVGALPAVDIERDLRYVDKYDLYAIRAYPKSKAEYWIITSPQAKEYIDRLKGKRTKGRLFVSYLDGSGVEKEAIRQEIWDLLVKAGIRKPNAKADRYARHEIKLDHGFRKTHSTVCEKAGLTDQQIAHLRGKKDTLAKIYQLPPPQEVIENNSYMKAVPHLVIELGKQ